MFGVTFSPRVARSGGKPSTAPEADHQCGCSLLDIHEV